MSDGDLAYWMKKRAEKQRTADPEFVDACIKLLEQKLKGEITMTQFLQGCEMLEQTALRYRSGT